VTAEELREQHREQQALLKRLTGRIRRRLVIAPDPMAGAPTDELLDP
jgi:hypothetical protein